MIFSKRKHLSKKDLEREELTRTQVLNLQELEKVANFETKTSKRPAFLFAFAGLLSISLGLSYSNIIMAVDNISLLNNVQPEKIVNHREIIDMPVELPVVTDKKICTKVETNEIEGTKKIYIYELYFKEMQLQSYYKKAIVSKLDNFTQGPASIENINNIYEPLTNLQIDGYKIEKAKDLEALKITIDINLSTLDKTKLIYNPENSQNNLITSNPFTNVEFNFGTNQNIIKNQLVNNGYRCQ